MQDVIDDVKNITPSSGSRQRLIFSTTGTDSHVNIQARDNASAADQCRELLTIFLFVVINVALWSVSLCFQLLLIHLSSNI